MLNLIASYPKSGNTMVRIFLAHYLRGSVDLNAVGFPLYLSDHFFPFGLPNDPAERYPVCRTDPCFAKTHEVTDNFYPASAARALYIVRNPLDVVPSWANHMMTTYDGAIAAMSKPTTLKPLEHASAQFIGTWSTNVLGWLECPKIPVRAVRYETLVSDPARAFKMILSWFEVPFEKERFAAALAFVRFDNLAAIEHKTGFKEARGTAGFFRQGKAGKWSGVLTVDQARRVWADHARAMKLLGYSP